MDSRNHVQLIGRLGGEPTVRDTKSGKVARFSIAINEQFAEEGQSRSNTQWHNVVAWRKLAEKIEASCHKGNEVLVCGKLTSHSYEDQNKVKKYITEVLASEIVCMSKNEQKEIAVA